MYGHNDVHRCQPKSPMLRNRGDVITDQSKEEVKNVSIIIKSVPLDLHSDSARLKLSKGGGCR